MSLSRRSLLRALPVPVLLAAVSACGSASGTSANGTTRTVSDVDGKQIEVPERPVRVVALSEPTIDAVLALGVTPVGTVAGRGQSGIPNYLAGKGTGVPVVAAVGTPDFEAVGAVRPDLIVVDGTSINNNPQALEALGHVAPVVFTGYAGGDWRANFTITADALNLAEKGAEVLAAYDERVTGVKAALVDKGLDQKTYSIVRWQGNGAALVLKELPPGRALTDLGMKRPPNQDTEGRGHSEPVSLENIADIDADYMFFGTLGGSSVGNPDAGGSADVDAADEALESAQAVPGFAALNAVAQDHVIPVDGSVWTSTEALSSCSASSTTSTRCSSARPEPPDLSHLFIAGAPR